MLNKVTLRTNHDREYLASRNGEALAQNRRRILSVASLRRRNLGGMDCAEKKIKLIGIGFNSAR